MQGTLLEIYCCSALQSPCPESQFVFWSNLQCIDLYFPLSAHICNFHQHHKDLLVCNKGKMCAMLGTSQENLQMGSHYLLLTKRAMKTPLINLLWLVHIAGGPPVETGQLHVMFLVFLNQWQNFQEHISQKISFCVGSHLSCLLHPQMLLQSYQALFIQQ